MDITALLRNFIVVSLAMLVCTACATVSPITCNKSSTDGDVTEAVQMRLHGDRGLNDQNIHVSTFERTVTLSGTVANPTQASVAVVIAKNTPGVCCVVSKLKLRCCEKFSEFQGKSSTAFSCGS